MGPRIVAVIVALGSAAASCTLTNPNFTSGDASDGATTTGDPQGSGGVSSEAPTSAGDETSSGSSGSGGASMSTTDAVTSTLTTTDATTEATTNSSSSTSSTSTTNSTNSTSTTTDDSTTEPTGGESDSESDSDSDTEADDLPPGACGIPASAWVFTELAPITAIQTNQFEGDPYFLADTHTLYFSRETAQDGDDIFVASRKGFGQPFGPPQKAAALGLNGPHGDSRVALSGDRLRVYFATNRPGGPGMIDVWAGSRADDKLPFAGLAPLPTVNSDGNDFDPFISGDELRLYFAPVIGGSREIAVAARVALGEPFGAPQALAVINDPIAAEANPSLTADERVIVFTSLRSGNAEIYLATRPSTAVDFEAPTALGPPINEPGSYEGEPFLAEGDEGCELYFISDRLGSWDIFRARITGG